MGSNTREVATINNASKLKKQRWKKTYSLNPYNAKRRVSLFILIVIVKVTFL